MKRSSLILMASYAVGALIAVSDGLATPGEALTKGTYLNAPGPLIAIQAVAALAALRGRRAGTIVLALATSLSLAATAFDGDVGHAGLTSAEVAFQLVEVAAIAAVWALSIGRLIQRRRPAPLSA
jgi:hypothetical protein